MQESKQNLTIRKSGVTTWITPLSYDFLIFAYRGLFHLLEVSVLDVLSLWAFLLSLLLTTIELVATRLAGCARLLVHLLRSSLPSIVEGCDGAVDSGYVA